MMRSKCRSVFICLSVVLLSAPRLPVAAAQTPSAATAAAISVAGTWQTDSGQLTLFGGQRLWEGAYEVAGQWVRNGRVFRLSDGIYYSNIRGVEFSYGQDPDNTGGY